MKKSGHIILAAILSFLFIYLTLYLGFSWFDVTWKSIGIVALIIVFYSVLPDIDHKGSSITWIFLGIGILGLIVGISLFLFKTSNPDPLVVLIFSTLFLILTFTSGHFFKHRGIVHTIQAGLIATFPVWFLMHDVFYCVLAYVAWHSHLIGDGLWFKTSA